MVTDSETEKNQTSLKNQGRQIKCSRTGYESTHRKRHQRNKSYEKNTKRIKKKRLPRWGRVQMIKSDRTPTIKYVLAESSRWLLQTKGHEDKHTGMQEKNKKRKKRKTKNEK